MSEFEIYGTGIDECEIDRIAKDLKKIPTFASEFCGPAEIEFLDSLAGKRRDKMYACFFAAKEAVVKAVGTEIPNWREIAISGDERKAQVQVLGNASQMVQELGIEVFKLSFGASRVKAIAVCTALTRTS